LIRQFLFDLWQILILAIPWMGGAAIASVIWVVVVFLPGNDLKLEQTAAPVSPIVERIIVTPIPTMSPSPTLTPEPLEANSPESGQPEVSSTPEAPAVLIAIAPMPVPTPAPTVARTLAATPTPIPQPAPCAGPGNSDGHAQGWKKKHC